MNPHRVLKLVLKKRKRSLDQQINLPLSRLDEKIDAQAPNVGGQDGDMHGPPSSQRTKTRKTMADIEKRRAELAEKRRETSAQRETLLALMKQEAEKQREVKKQLDAMDDEKHCLVIQLKKSLQAEKEARTRKKEEAEAAAAAAAAAATVPLNPNPNPALAQVKIIPSSSSDGKGGSMRAPPPLSHFPAGSPRDNPALPSSRSQGPFSPSAHLTSPKGGVPMSTPRPKTPKPHNMR